MSEETTEDTYFTFINPPNWESTNASPVFYLKSLAILSWQTNVNNYSIALGPFSNLRPELLQIYTKPSNEPEAGGFSWNISTVNLNSSVLAVGNLCLQAISLDDVFYGASNYFNIIDGVSSQGTPEGGMPVPITSTAEPVKLTTSVSTKSGESSLNFPISSLSEALATTTSFSQLSLSSTTTASMTSKSLLPVSSPTVVPNSSSDKTTLYTGLGVGLGMLLIIMCLLGLGTKIFLKRRHDPNIENSKSQIAPATSSERNSTLTSNFNPPVRVELPTPFNVVRSMKATFLAKFELPGKDNELPNPEGPFELAVD